MIGDKRLNVLWISLEDTSPRFGCYGDEVAKTPHLDRVAREGCVYQKAFSVAGVCAPSRHAVITGMYPTFTGAHHMRTGHGYDEVTGVPSYEVVPPGYVKCFTEYLRGAGYFCTNNEKTDYQFQVPFTAWDEQGEHGHWRNRREKGQPFFSVFNLEGSHESGMWERDGEVVTDVDAVSLPPYLPDTEKARRALARQYDRNARNDAKVGELLKQLEEDGLTEDTVVFIWSDHGEGLPRSKRWPYDGGIRVPLLVRWPGEVEGGSVSHDVVSLIDLAPTVLSICGVEVPGHLQGNVFLGKEREAPRRYVYATRDRYDTFYDMMRAVRDERFKYICNYYPNLSYLEWNPYRNRHPVMQEMWRLYAEDGLNEAQALMFREGRPVEELYDTEADPYEMRNLAGDPVYGETLRRMRGALKEWQEKYDVWGDVNESEMVERFWPGGEQPKTAMPKFYAVGVESELEELEAKYPPELAGEVSYGVPVVVQVFCGTQGASVGYALNDEDEPRWELYRKPIRLGVGCYRLRVKAHRIGYGESEVREVRVEVRG